MYVYPYPGVGYMAGDLHPYILVLITSLYVTYIYIYIYIYICLNMYIYIYIYIYTNEAYKYTSKYIDNILWYNTREFHDLPDYTL